MAHMAENYAEIYQQLSDDELLNLATETPQLCPEAAQALEHEIRARNIKPIPKRTWTRNSGETVKSLQDYETYRRLCRRKAFMSKYAYPLMFGPFFLVLGLTGNRIDNSGAIQVIFLLVMLFIAMVPICSVFLGFRWAAFRCPQ